jgi:hypothetical protein
MTRNDTDGKSEPDLKRRIKSVVDQRLRMRWVTLILRQISGLLSIASTYPMRSALASASAMSWTTPSSGSKS